MKGHIPVLFLWGAQDGVIPLQEVVPELSHIFNVSGEKIIKHKYISTYSNNNKYMYMHMYSYICIYTERKKEQASKTHEQETGTMAQRE